MKHLKNKSGFTLIEIIVVLIIVGILAAIALPNLFSNVQRSRAEEALATISSYRPSMEGCIVKAAGVLESATCTTALVGAPTSSQNFVYNTAATVGPTGANTTGYTIVAVGTNALTNTDTITVAKPNSLWPTISTAITCTGAGVLLGAC